MGAVHNWTWTFISIGIIAADVAQHLTFSIVKKDYTPGIATTALYVIYVVYFLNQRQIGIGVDDLLAWIAMAVGAAFIGNRGRFAG